MSDLNDKQSKIISFIQNYYTEYGISPTVREIQSGCNITSTSVVDYNLKALKNKGYLDKRPDISRAIKLNSVNDNILKIPILSSIAAGEPLIVNPDQITASDDYDDYVELPNNFSKEKKYHFWCNRIFKIVNHFSTSSRISYRFEGWITHLTMGYNEYSHCLFKEKSR